MLKHKTKRNRDGQEIIYKPKKIELEIDTFDWAGFWKESLDDVNGVKKLQIQKIKVKKEKKVEKDGKKKKRK